MYIYLSMQALVMCNFRVFIQIRIFQNSSGLDDVLISDSYGFLCFLFMFLSFFLNFRFKLE